MCLCLVWKFRLRQTSQVWKNGSLSINAPHVKCSSFHSEIFPDRCTRCAAQMASDVNTSWSSVLWSSLRAAAVLYSESSISATVTLSRLPSDTEKYRLCQGKIKALQSCKSAISAVRIVDLKMVFLFHCVCQFKYAFWTQYLCLKAVTVSFTGIWVCLSKSDSMSPDMRKDFVHPVPCIWSVHILVFI